jgi:hypothetical protein
MLRAILFFTVMAFAFLGLADTVRARHHHGYASASRRERAALPNLDVEAGCKDIASNGLNKTTDYKGCLSEELQARIDLQKEWVSYSAGIHDQCMHLVTPPALPSYVTLQECLRLSRAAQRMSKTDGATGIGKTMKSPSRN